MASTPVRLLSLLGAALLSAAPATGFGFFSDPACATAVTQITVAAAATQERFYVRGTAAGAVLVTAASIAPVPLQDRVSTGWEVPKSSAERSDTRRKSSLKPGVRCNTTGDAMASAFAELRGA